MTNLPIKLMQNIFLLILSAVSAHAQAFRVVEMTSPNFDPRPSGVAIDTIVLHGTATASRKQALDILTHERSQRSAHYLVDRVGTVYRIVPEDKMAWHAGDAQMADGRHSVNEFSIGIELVNRNDGAEQYSQEQISALRLLIADIRSRHQIKNIVTHAQISFPQGRKNDPRGFDLTWLHQEHASP